MDRQVNPVPSVSPGTADLASVSPELMNISPLTGATSPDVSSQPAPHVLDLLQKQEWLLEQKTQLEAQLIASKPGFAQELDTMNAEELEQLCSSLQAELLVKTEVHDSRQALTKSERVYQTAMSLLDSAGTENDANGETVQSLFSELVEVAEEVGKQHKENVELQAELDKCKKENFELQNKSRFLYLQVERRKNEKEEELETLTNNASGKSIKEQQKAELDRHKVQSNVLQKLILGSGTNWMQDEKTRTVLLECGKGVNI